MNIEEIMIEKGMARALFVDTWANEMEEQGRSFRPQADLMDLAPATPAVAIKEAYRLTGQLEASNAQGILTLLSKAARKDGTSLDEMTESSQAEYAQSFGHYMAMEALGHGVSWFDDHAKFAIDIPDFEGGNLLGHPSTMDYGQSMAPSR